MSCSVAVSGSPVFSPQRIPLTCMTSPETLAVGLTQNHFSPAATSNLSRSVPLLKRKRPARIDIPNMGLEAIEPPLASDGRREVEEECARYSVYCKRGRKRVEMEDRHSASVDLQGDSQMAFFGVFDGHGGSKASQFASENIGKRILEEVMSGEGEERVIGVEEEVKNGYLKTDAEFLKEQVKGGTCCVTAFVMKGDLIVSNAGDCRAVMSVSGAAEALTSDHRPSREDEKDRIERMGGYIDCSRGVWRLQGSLAVSRGIGDSHLKQWVIPEPETRVIKIEPECEFLILASDGLWEKVSNQEAVDIARPLCVDPQKPTPLSACKKLVNLSISRGSMDDISVMIIQLGHFI
ncbi:probable protein phosphatase 2C 25 [Dendrobium catenatum]|uniref:protein-serine/threonine phosphatase n=1 Tax=Dendrobium catenatum TaxID=906689 RepID=A0A2I0WZU3_9ASPA|nr:probable protein phosphatase 2C 25 [Dendrobium catenatum]PKU81178.1 putative protein phosphatase 2C 2 [Dendrobium catenatum]